MIRPLVVATVIVALAGCASASNDTSSPIRPIEPILAGEIDIIADPSGTTATLAVETNVAVACSVIYGVDESFGSIAVDNDMQGGAHDDHRPLLSGLTPDTEYHYILQGSDAAGTIYRSDVMSFTTPPATESAFGVNVAIDGTVSQVSSEFSGAFSAAKAIDGDLSTEWSTDGDGDAAWIEIDLGRSRTISAVAFRTRQMSDGTAVANTFTVTIGGTTLGPFPTGADAAILDTAVAGRLVRVDVVETTGGNTGATEIELYANG